MTKLQDCVSFTRMEPKSTMPIPSPSPRCRTTDTCIAVHSSSASDIPCTAMFKSASLKSTTHRKPDLHMHHKMRPTHLVMSYSGCRSEQSYFRTHRAARPQCGIAGDDGGRGCYGCYDGSECGSRGGVACDCHGVTACEVSSSMKDPFGRCE